MLTAAMKRYASFVKVLPPPFPMFNQTGLPITWSLPWMSFFYFTCMLLSYIPLPQFFPLKSPACLFWSAEACQRQCGLGNPSNSQWFYLSKTLKISLKQRRCWSCKGSLPIHNEAVAAQRDTKIVCQPVAMLQACLSVRAMLQHFPARGKCCGEQGSKCGPTRSVWSWKSVSQHSSWKHLVPVFWQE